MTCTNPVRLSLLRQRLPHGQVDRLLTRVDLSATQLFRPWLALHWKLGKFLFVPGAACLHKDLRYLLSLNLVLVLSESEHAAGQLSQGVLLVPAIFILVVGFLASDRVALPLVAIFERARPSFCCYVLLALPHAQATSLAFHLRPPPSVIEAICLSLG